ncbi:EscU/YscU/HrcU family type III secretion system export apparatus switch protein [Candidatus Poribacteria bacterium]
MKYHTRRIKSERDAQQKAAALKYNAQISSAPVVKAKGVGDVAEKIIKVAREHNIPIKEDADLVELLVQLDLEQEIPPELYKIVAEILAFVYNLDRSRQQI